jgi:hypothetical protein
MSVEARAATVRLASSLTNRSRSERDAPAPTSCRWMVRATIDVVRMIREERSLPAVIFTPPLRVSRPSATGLRV